MSVCSGISWWPVGGMECLTYIEVKVTDLASELFFVILAEERKECLKTQQLLVV
jgi:uncharacterized membrane protein